MESGGQDLRYPKLLQEGDTIGVCAPSSGLLNNENLKDRLDKAKTNVGLLGYNIIETPSVRKGSKCTSANAQTRAREFMNLYEAPSVAAIIPPWGGEFLMDMLPHLDFQRLDSLPPTWICGYSDTSLLNFVLTTKNDIATIHGSALLNMGYSFIHESDLRAFDAMSHVEILQHSSSKWGTYTGWDISKNVYDLSHETTWKSLNGESYCEFGGRMIGGCLDVLRTIMGTRFADISSFLSKYQNDGFIWTLESCEMNSGDIYRVLWQMREAGWFAYCKGVLFGRPDGYCEIQDFTLQDALEQGLGCLDVPVLFDADIGHIPPQIQIINGSCGQVTFKDGFATILQKMTL